MNCRKSWWRAEDDILRNRCMKASALKKRRCCTYRQEEQEQGGRRVLHGHGKRFGKGKDLKSRYFFWHKRMDEVGYQFKRLFLSVTASTHVMEEVAAPLYRL